MVCGVLTQSTSHSYAQTCHPVRISRKVAVFFLELNADDADFTDSRGFYEVVGCLSSC